MDATLFAANVRAAKDFVPRPGCIVDPRDDPVQHFFAGAAQRLSRL